MSLYLWMCRGTKKMLAWPNRSLLRHRCAIWWQLAEKQGECANGCATRQRDGRLWTFMVGPFCKNVHNSPSLLGEVSICHNTVVYCETFEEKSEFWILALDKYPHRSICLFLTPQKIMNNIHTQCWLGWTSVVAEGNMGGCDFVILHKKSTLILKHGAWCNVTC